MAKRASKGQGTISKRGNSWRGRLTIGYDENGKQIYKSFTAPKQKEVQRMMDKYRAEHYMDQVTKVYTLAEWHKEWLHDHMELELSPRSFNRYDGIYRNYILTSALAKIKLDDLTPVMIQNYLKNGIKNETFTLNTAYTIRKNLVSSLYKAFELQIIPKNPASRIKLPKLNKNTKIQAHTAEEQKKIMESLTDRVEDLAIGLDYCLGLRLGEIRGLKWSKIDFTEKEIHITNQLSTYTKNGERITEYAPLKTPSSMATLPLPEKAIQYLKRRKLLQMEEKIKNKKIYQDTDYLFTNEIGQPLEEKRLPRRFGQLCKEAEVQVLNLHSIRHSYCTRLFEANVPLKTVQKLMRHGSMTTTTNIYTHVMKEKEEEAMQALDELYRS